MMEQYENFPDTHLVRNPAGMYPATYGNPKYPYTSAYGGYAYSPGYGKCPAIPAYGRYSYVSSYGGDPYVSNYAGDPVSEFKDESNPCCQWINKNILIQQYNKFSILSYSFEDTDKCVLTSSTTEGPFYLENSMVRKDVREYQHGVDLLLRLKIVDVKGCKAIPGLTVDIWHASALGVYSGFTAYPNIQIPMGQKPVPSDRETFLRGRQYTDQNGMVEFLTIYPGSYAPRTVHIHAKILDDSKEILTTQLFFPQELTNKIHSLPPYNLKPLSPYTNENDMVLRASHGVQGGWPKLTELGDRYYMGTLTIGVDYSRPI